MKKAAAVVVILLILGGGYWLFRKKPASQESQNQHTSMPAEKPKPETSEKPAGEESKKETSPKVEPPPVQTVQEISMTTGSFFFSPNVITLTKGRPVKITIQSSGRHTFTIDDLAVNQSLPDGTSVVQFTPNQAGVFIYYCAIPGHRQAGQWGTVTVEE